MSRDRLEVEMTEFERKVVALIEQLGEEIAVLASDESEFEHGLGVAAVTLLDQAMNNDDEEYEDSWDEDDWDDFEDEDEEDLFDPFRDLTDALVIGEDDDLHGP